ncbi:uncharacterized protein [Diadema setosum]|uniref:uncharacterized protein n=1 Tax=Diadema setosum TaxID=31175 RepID=UPI003B3A9383
MQSTVIVFSVAFAALLGFAAATDLPQNRERRAPSEGFEPATWDNGDEAGMGNGFRADGIAKRIADNDFAALRHQEREDSLRRSLLLQAMNDMMARAGKRSSPAQKRSFTHHDYAALRQELESGRLYRALLDQLLGGESTR